MRSESYSIPKRLFPFDIVFNIEHKLMLFLFVTSKVVEHPHITIPFDDVKCYFKQNTVRRLQN